MKTALSWLKLFFKGGQEVSDFGSALKENGFAMGDKFRIDVVVESVGNRTGDGSGRIAIPAGGDDDP